MTRTEGFEAARPFLEVAPNSPGMRIQVDNPAADPARAKAALKRSQTELARLLLGLTGGTQPGFPVTYAYGGQAESPDGKADIIDVTGPTTSRLRLFVDSRDAPAADGELHGARAASGHADDDARGRGGRGSGAAPVVVPGAQPASTSPGAAAPAGAPAATVRPHQRPLLRRTPHTPAAPHRWRGDGRAHT